MSKLSLKYTFGDGN